MIQFKCASCGLALSVSDDKAGMKGKCPKCGQPMLIPTSLPHLIGETPTLAIPEGQPEQRHEVSALGVLQQAARKHARTNPMPLGVGRRKPPWLSKTCPKCHGLGQVSCECKGTGRVSCSVCGGEKQVHCPSCGGTGGNCTCPECKGTGRGRCQECGGQGWQQCPTCGGTKYQKCQVCFGGGFKLLGPGSADDKNYSGTPEKCIACGGTGKIECRTCGGSRNVRCAACSGTGSVGRCSMCDGKGKLGPCTSCGTTGKVICANCQGAGEFECSCGGTGKKPCDMCHGTGRVALLPKWMLGCLVAVLMVLGLTVVGSYVGREHISSRRRKNATDDGVAQLPPPIQVRPPASTQRRPGGTTVPEPVEERPVASERLLRNILNKYEGEMEAAKRGTTTLQRQLLEKKAKERCEAELTKHLFPVEMTVRDVGPSHFPRECIQVHVNRPSSKAGFGSNFPIELQIDDTRAANMGQGDTIILTGQIELARASEMRHTFLYKGVRVVILDYTWEVRRSRDQ
jgi:hypothetical protein